MEVWLFSSLISRQSLRKAEATREACADLVSLVINLQRGGGRGLLHPINTFLIALDAPRQV